MSHPYAPTPKRLSPTSPSAAPPPMKKSRPQPSTSEKNGLHQPSDLGPAARTNGEEDEEMAAELAGPDGLPIPISAPPAAGVAANLFRKKATPPQPPAAARKTLRIKIGQPKLPSNFEEDTWAILKDAITAIFLKQKLSCDVEKLYQATGDLCLHKLGGNLYERIKKECDVHISAKLSSLVGQSPDLVVFLSLVQRTWQDFCDQMLIIRGITLLLDVKYVKNIPNLCSVWDMGLQLFRKHLTRSLEIEHKTITGLLRLIESESSVQSGLVKQ